MAVILKAHLEERFELPCDFDTAFDFLADVKKTAEYFPDVEQVVDLGDGCYRWEMKETGVSKFRTQPIYACKYVFDRDKGRVEWTPIDGVGNCRNEGSSQMEKAGDKTRVHFTTTIEAEAPIPGFARRIVQPFVDKEFKKKLEIFRDNVIRALS